MLEIDAFFLNEDRHTNNIAVQYNVADDTYALCPLFDNGLSLLADTNINDLSLLYFFAVARPHSYYKAMGVFLSSSSTKVFHGTTRLASGFRNTKRPGSRVSCRAEN